MPRQSKLLGTALLDTPSLLWTPFEESQANGQSGKICLTLPIRSDVIADRPDLRLEPHVEHAVGLVQHQEGHSQQIGRFHLDQIDQSTLQWHNGDSEANNKRRQLTGVATTTSAPASKSLDCSYLFPPP